MTVPITRYDDLVPHELLVFTLSKSWIHPSSAPRKRGDKSLGN